MGGHRGGDFASSTAIKLIGEEFMKLDSSTFEAEDRLGGMAAGNSHSCKSTYSIIMQMKMKTIKGWERHLKQLLFMDVPVLFPILETAVYMQSMDNGVRQVTRDHSYVNVLLDSGEITEEEAAVHPQT